MLLVLLSATGYAFLPIWSKYIYSFSSLEALDVMIWRFTFATPVIWLAIGIKRLPRSSASLPRWRLIGIGMVFGVAAVSAFAALSRLPASIYTVLIYTYPAIVAVASLTLGEKLSRTIWIALSFTLVGILLTVPVFETRFQSISQIGILFTLLNAISYAAYIILSHSVLRNQRTSIHASAWSITGSMLFASGLFIIRGLNMPDQPEAWGALVGLAIVSTVLPILTFYAGMERLGAARAAIISTAEPIFTLILAVVLLQEHLSGLQLLGSVLILGSVFLLQYFQTPDRVIVDN